MSALSTNRQPHVLRRYACGYWVYRRRLSRSQWDSADKIAAGQLAKLQSLLRDAAANVPYYRDLFRQLGATPEDFRQLSDLSRLPVLSKQTVREQPGRFVNPHHVARHVFEDHTSGSTGQPLRFLLTREQKYYEMAYNIRFYRWAGYRTGARVAAFRHYIPRTERDPLWQYKRNLHTLFFSVYDMKASHLPGYIEAFNRFRPEFVRGYPSSIYILAQYATANKLTVHSPRAVLSSSETLSPEMRSVIERALRCPVYDWWGSNERVVTACQCERRDLYHVNAEGGILELIPQQDASGAMVHRMVGTGLLNHAMPLIRYDIGDLAVPSEPPCPCGRGLPVIAGIVGRVDDLIVTGEQKFVPPVRFYTLFETYEKVNQFQVVQTAPSEVVVRLALLKPLTEEELAGLRTKLCRFLGDGVKIDFQFPDRIAPEPSGKVRNVISQVTR